MTNVDQPTTRRTVLRIDRLAKTYGHGAGAKQAIADVGFDVHHGELVCVVGPSGAGKTTLLKCVAGLLPPTDGVVELDGKPITEPPEQLGLIFQDYSRSLLPWLTVLGNVTLPLRAKGTSKTKAGEQAMEMLAAVGLGTEHRSYPWQLSGGMQQRVAIARGLAYQPEVLLMDEPFASVDAQTRMALEDLVLRLRRQFDLTIVFVTHDIDEAVYLADRVIVLSPAPTRVAEIVDIDLPEPRDQITTKAEHSFGELRAHILKHIIGNNHQPQEELEKA
ncbi:ABC transporter ATP-binding protein [Pseudonocardia nigra]|uniref:ABC transporter ATP-binding protein n=1 Tax=Pseudonocardia nigra TaxID=1921578 RepID=UPI001C5EEA7F|nr:ABC transporter ATP-binding protein [Pseudonocardia nigra]